MIRRIIILLLLVGGICISELKSQNYIFSQTYSSPTIVSPSFTGLISKDRLALNFRDQWPGINHTYVTYALTYDHYQRKLNSGFGLQLLKDRAGDGDLGVTSLKFLYSYNLRINNEWYVRPGMSFSYSERSINYNKLIFPDQLLNPAQPTTTETSLGKDKTQYIDMTISGLAYTKKYWAGITVENLLRPEQSFGVASSRLPMRYIVMGGTTIPIRQRSRRLRQTNAVSFTALYRMQELRDQFDLGAYYTKTPFVMGIWLRGFPIISAFSDKANIMDAIIFLFGYSVGELNIGYSFDFTVSNLLSSSQGAHEISLVYKFHTNVKRNSRKKYAAIPCPGF